MICTTLYLFSVHVLELDEFNILSCFKVLSTGNELGNYILQKDAILLS